MLYKLTCKDRADMVFIHHVWSLKDESAVITALEKKYGWQVLDLESQHLLPFLWSKTFGKVGSATTVPIEALILFYRQFAMMQKNNVNLKTSLGLCALSADNKSMKSVCEAILDAVQNGKPLAEALAAFPYIFDRMSIAMINAGIKSNSLGDTLLGLAESTELSYEMNKKLNNASIYPMITLFIAAIVLVVFSYFVIPKFLPLYNAIPGGMPAVTRMLVSVSEFMTSQPWSVVLVILVPLVIFKKKRDIARSVFMQNLFHRLPGIKVLTRNIYMSHYLGMLAQLSDAGLPILQRIRILEEASQVKMYKDMWFQVGEEISNGGANLSEALAQHSDVLPAMVVGNIRAAEVSGEVPRTAAFLADFYTREVRHGVANIQVLIEPFFVLLVAGFVGFLLFGMFLPLFDITKLAQ